MPFDISVDGLDRDDFQDSVNELVKEAVLEHVEEKLSSGEIECPNCGCSNLYANTWEDSTGQFNGGAVCVDCNARVDVDIDASEFDL